MIAPASRVGGVGHEADFEYHTPQEEIFVQGGSVGFGNDDRVDPIAYLNHPPYWLHPAEQRFHRIQEMPMLIRPSRPLDTTYLPIPDVWDGFEYSAWPEGQGSPRGRAITRLLVDHLVYSPVLRDGVISGDLSLHFGGRLATDREDVYSCSSNAFQDELAHMVGGLLAVRWTRPTGRITLPQINHQAASE
ncbi:MAG: hypothetical protein U0556_12610 [Dehalococcoidia bacterium]